MPPQRHSLVWLAARGWDCVQGTAAPEPVAIRDAISRWRAADWPLVVRRAEPDAANDSIAVGIALPPDTKTGVKPRVGAMIASLDISRQALPVTVASVLPMAPPHWRAALLALHLESTDSLPPMRVFGSLAWQSITGMPYLRTASDIDLLFAPHTRQELDDGIALLARYAALLPLDGEVVFPCGAAVAWKEWRNSFEAADPGADPAADPPATRVLAKRRCGVSLVTCAALLATFDTIACNP